jgi:hypothetical protein
MRCVCDVGGRGVGFGEGISIGRTGVGAGEEEDRISRGVLMKDDSCGERRYSVVVDGRSQTRIERGERA